VAAIDTATGRRIGIDANGRYAMCSVFKLPLAAFVLRLCDRRTLDPGEMLRFGPGDALDNSPVVQANLRRGRLSVEALAAAIVQQSDNSAANLLLRRVGGPSALRRFVRSCGDRATRVDRYEMALNSNVAGDPRDTTTPIAMAEFARTVLLGRVLTPTAVRKLADWLVTSVAKPDRLAAGFPKGWKVGHKPGTGRNGAVNDVAIVWPPQRPPIIVACFVSGGTVDSAARAAAHRAVAGIVAKTFA
jgi:beta-lactamase class A